MKKLHGAMLDKATTKGKKKRRKFGAEAGAEKTTGAKSSGGGARSRGGQADLAYVGGGEARGGHAARSVRCAHAFVRTTRAH